MVAFADDAPQQQRHSLLVQVRLEPQDLCSDVLKQNGDVERFARLRKAVHGDHWFSFTRALLCVRVQMSKNEREVGNAG